MDSQSKLQRDNTMQATAKEGIEYLQKNQPDLAEQCKAVAKDQSENRAGDASSTTDNADSPPKLTRDNTAEEGIAYLHQQGAYDVIKLHGLDKISPRSKVASPAKSKPMLVRNNTMMTTAKEGKEYLEKQGGVHSNAKTRSQDTELNSSTEETKSTTKRSAEDDSEEVDENPKKAKTDKDDSNDASSEEDKKDD